MNSEKQSMSHNTRVTKPTRFDESDGMRRRVRASPSLIFFWRRKRGSYLWAEGAVKCHPQNSDGDVAIEVLSVSVWVYPSVLVLFGMYVVAVVTAVVLCHALRISSTSTCHQRGRTLLWVMLVMGKAGHRLQ